MQATVSPRADLTGPPGPPPNPPAPPEPPPIDRRRVARSIVVVVLAMLAPVAIKVSAQYTGTTVNPASSFASGTVDISTSPSSALLTMANMAPGDAITAPVTVSNPGSLQLRYAITSTTTENSLAAQLVLTVRSGITALNCTTANIGTGSGVYSGVLGTTTGTAVAGSTTQGAQAGDRTLAAAGSEVLCFSVSLPSNVTSVSTTTTTATFAFAAEQVAHNP